jgi:DHA2 family multidrug resistance protein
MNQASPYPSPLRRWLIILTVMSGTLMQVLDATIANVALPQMQAALGANPETINWTLTSYIVAAAIATPSTGWLETRIGRRNLLGIAVIGFTVSSAACGLATSLPMMVIARTVQGMFGALIGPLSQATMLDNSPADKRAQSMLIFTMGATVGPIMGPVLGGWLTDNYNWRWVFFINIPIGILATIGVFLLLDKKRIPHTKFDLFGFSLLVLALASFQLMLDRGTQLDWFESTEILIEAGIVIGAMWMFIVHVATSKDSILPIGLLRNSNYIIALLFTMLLMGSTIAGPALLAPMLQGLLGYDTLLAGLVMMPRGMGAMIAMPIATILIRRVDPRILIMVGMTMNGVAFWMMSGFDMQMGQNEIILSSFMHGLSAGFTFMPITIIAFSSVGPLLSTEAAVFFNLARNVGASVTISIMGALLAHNLQVNHAELGESITAINIPLLQHQIVGRLGLTDTIARMLDAEINRQAMMISYINDYWLMMWMALLILPLLLFMRKPTGFGKMDVVVPE